MRRVVLVAALVACRPADDGPVDTDTLDTVVDTVVDTERPVETDDTEVPDETDDTEVPVDTEPTPTCSEALPTGPCPGPAACVAGRCLVDLDPGNPVPAGAVDDWDDIAAYIGTRSQLLDARPGVDWATVSADGHAAVAAATTAFDAAWAMMSATARLRDGHTLVRPSDVCRYDPGFADPHSNVGACVTASGDALVVLHADPTTGWRDGDVLLDVDGRDAADLVADRLAQPRCGGWSSTDAGVVGRAIGSLLWRPDGERVAHVRRDGRDVAVPLSYGRFVTCAPRLPVAGEAVLIGRATTATLPGGVALIALPEMGVSQGADFVGPPLIDALRTHLAGLAPGTPLIFDLRGNGGGFGDVASAIGSWLLPTGTELWRCHERFGEAPGDVGPLRPILAVDDPLDLTGPVAVLTDAGTYGFGEYLPWIVAQTHRGVLVGAPTNGAFGVSWRVPVGPWGAIVNALRCERPDGTPLDGDPPPVDLPVELTAADLAAGVDTVLEAARQAVLAAP